ncbi:hypothetical protein A2645_01485 [Candidatus Nomurabacteria bacterium RIFCSPHIGHO2_01_FULL_39_9]|uniref:HTH HARE-type domain-containing protein n=1 Tax=Candidatus Nomurabacteria bacterium RIFCSPHIGHO2_01_FULL_39_9 TaxID=1801735 RepID=A0A1F6UY20_9BACT|nr:MAG: hypothetical protein A2645_01485 [Candidatus Nomurabacteria bacterium RIFCSPHIGHO2_01_FULL_39_9]
MNTISFKPKQTTKKILSGLNDRAYDVIVSRFGLEGDTPKTLKAIGERYDITRERVRQIEGAALNALRKSDSFKAEQNNLAELKDYIESIGSVVAVEDLLKQLAKDEEAQNHFRFYLVLSPDFTLREEDDDFKERVFVDESIADGIESGFEKFHAWLCDDHMLSDDDLAQQVLNNLKDLPAEYRKKEFIKSWITISKHVVCNLLGEWGKASAPHIRLKGIKDYAYLVLRRHGSPLHFTEVAKSIGSTFGRKTNTATCHNELIKDRRFVIVGRGKYALTEWGYRPGVVREVISELLKKEGPLSREDIIDSVLKERFVEKNTIIVNLQNPKYFRKNREGLFNVA